MVVSPQQDDNSLCGSGAAVPATPYFTIFTATYNRAHTLHRVYDTLRTQTCRDFEWLVIDDGSEDNTSELIAGWAEVTDFPVRYFKQKNRGKHIAHNRAVQESCGFLFVTLDSDDALVPDALEKIRQLWNSIPEAQRASFSGLGGLCCDQHGTIVGDQFPRSPMDSDLRELHYLYKVRGEKCGVSRTDILRQYLFPEIEGTQWLPEGVLGLQLAKLYKRRYVNEVFRIYYVDESHARGVTVSDRANLKRTAPGRLYYNLWVLNNEIENLWRAPVPFLKAAVMLPVVTWVSGQPFAKVFGSLESVSAKALVLLVLPFAPLVYLAGNVSSVFRRFSSVFRR
jgi:glycosyltransferase involved in cell wall biosynthesis